MGFRAFGACAALFYILCVQNIDAKPVTPADFRAAIARRRIQLYKIAALVGVHPTSLGLVLDERRPLRPVVAAKLLAALGTLEEIETARAGGKVPR